MLHPDEHCRLLQTFEVDRLLDLFTLEAKKHHDGHYTIFSFTTGYTVAFGTPDIHMPRASAYGQVYDMRSFATLKEAIIDALVQGKTFSDYFDGAFEEWWKVHMSGEMAPCLTSH
jgi:hypothetical protein